MGMNSGLALRRDARELCGDKVLPAFLSSHETFTLTLVVFFGGSIFFREARSSRALRHGVCAGASGSPTPLHTSMPARRDSRGRREAHTAAEEWRRAVATLYFAGGRRPRSLPPRHIGKRY